MPGRCRHVPRLASLRRCGERKVAIGNAPSNRAGNFVSEQGSLVGMSNVDARADLAIELAFGRTLTSFQREPPRPRRGLVRRVPRRSLCARRGVRNPFRLSLTLRERNVAALGEPQRRRWGLPWLELMDQCRFGVCRGRRRPCRESPQLPAAELEQFHVWIRRQRAEQLRELLAQPSRLDLETFNREVWSVETATYLRGAKLVPGEVGGGKSLDSARIADVRQAFADGELELHGNYMWGSGAQRIRRTAPTKRSSRSSNSSAKLSGSSTGTTPPLEKAERIIGIPRIRPQHRDRPGDDLPP